MEDWLAFFEGTEGPLAYLAIGGSALLEYVFPPFPGDTATLVAVFLAATADYAWWLVFLVLTAGSTLGGVLVWRFGVWLQANEERWPAFLKDEQTRARIESIRTGFERRGGWYLAANRFVPAFRALFFVAAGLAGMRLRSVVFFGGLGAAAWNGLLMGVGFSIGANLERFETLFQDFKTGGLVVFVFVVLIASVVLLRGKASNVGSDDVPP